MVHKSTRGSEEVEVWSRMLVRCNRPNPSKFYDENVIRTRINVATPRQMDRTRTADRDHGQLNADADGREPNGTRAYLGHTPTMLNIIEVPWLQ